MGHILFTIIFTGLFCPPLSDTQGAAADFDASITDCDIDHTSERKKMLDGCQYFMYEKLVSNFYGVNLSLKISSFLSFFGGLKQLSNVQKY